MLYTQSMLWKAPRYGKPDYFAACSVQCYIKKLSKDIECIQKRCLELLFTALSFTVSLSKCGLERLDDRRDMITQSMFRQIKDSKHPLHYLLPPVKVSQMVLQPTYPYQIPLAKTSCYGRDFVPYCISKKFQLCCIIFMFRFVLSRINVWFY